MSDINAKRNLAAATVHDARVERDAIIDQATADFDQALADAYEAGLSLNDLRFATGLSVSTLRFRLKLFGVEVRGTGKPLGPLDRRLPEK